MKGEVVIELKLGNYILALLIISFGFFFVIASILKTEEAYRDVLLTIAVTHLVMSKLIVIKMKQEL